MIDDGTRVKLVEMAYQMAREGGGAGLPRRANEALPRFRLFYHHLAVSVDEALETGSAANAARAATDKELEGLK